MNSFFKILIAPLVVLALVIAAPFILLVIIWIFGWIILLSLASFFTAVAARIAVSMFWLPRGIRFLVVYSESARWQSYFEDEVIPAFGRSAQVINLSRDGGKWWHIDWWIYKHYALLYGSIVNERQSYWGPAFWNGHAVVRHWTAPRLLTSSPT